MLRRTEQLMRADANAILRTTFGMEQRDMNKFLDELVSEGLVEVVEKDGFKYYGAANGPSLYSVVQEKILEDLYRDGKIQ